jgi:hypothetical protein
MVEPTSAAKSRVQSGMTRLPAHRSTRCNRQLRPLRGLEWLSGADDSGGLCDGLSRPVQLAPCDARLRPRGQGAPGERGHCPQDVLADSLAHPSACWRACCRPMVVELLGWWSVSATGVPAAGLRASVSPLGWAPASRRQSLSIKAIVLRVSGWGVGQGAARRSALPAAEQWCAPEAGARRRAALRTRAWTACRPWTSLNAPCLSSVATRRFGSLQRHRGAPGTTGSCFAR